MGQFYIWGAQGLIARLWNRKPDEIAGVMLANLTPRASASSSKLGKAGPA